jgi:general secretion pathway protein E
VRLRIDGALKDQERLPPEFASALIARVKVLSDLDVSERRLPQDGRTTITVRGVPVDVRVSTTPTVFGESLVVRLLTRRGRHHSLDQLGMRAQVASGLQSLVHQSHGLILVTGPTGSGKTTTLYAALREITSSRAKILTIEDPIEFVFEDISQTQVNEVGGLTFSTALRSFLRHDPDVILVGEIRDTETARLAVQASLTGHLVLSTVHTNDAASTPGRLIDMGVEPFLLADALIGIVAQRLAPLLCSTCKRQEALTAEELEQLQRQQLTPPASPPYRATGCTHCDGSGRKGRRVLSELLVCDAQVTAQIAASAGAERLREIARMRPAFASLAQDGIHQSMVGNVDWTDARRIAER